MILDSGCKRSVAGRKWTEEYIAALGEKDKRNVRTKEVTIGQKFRFRGEQVFTATEEVRALVIIGSKRFNLQQSYFDLNNL